MSRPAESSVAFTKEWLAKARKAYKNAWLEAAYFSGGVIMCWTKEEVEDWARRRMGMSEQESACQLTTLEKSTSFLLGDCVFFVLRISEHMRLTTGDPGELVHDGSHGALLHRGLRLAPSGEPEEVFTIADSTAKKVFQLTEGGKFKEKFTTWFIKDGKLHSQKGNSNSKELQEVAKEEAFRRTNQHQSNSDSVAIVFQQVISHEESIRSKIKYWPEPRILDWSIGLCKGQEILTNDDTTCRAFEELTKLIATSDVPVQRQWLQLKDIFLELINICLRTCPSETSDPAALQ